MKLFIVCQPGLEAILQSELFDVGLIDSSVSVNPDSGGIAVEGDLSALYAVNLQLRTASRVLVRLDSFKATGFPEFKRKVARLDFSSFLRKGSRVEFHVTSKKSKLYHKGAIEQRIREVLEEKVGIQPSAQPNTESQTIIVRAMRDEFTISIDSSGGHLHKRGYRPAGAKAPLRETMAAAMLYHSGWDRKSPLIDPFCGAGTIPIEAAMMASMKSPGMERRFEFENWPSFDAAAFKLIKMELTAGEISETRPVITGYDRDEGAIQSSCENAKRAGVSDGANFNVQSLSDLTPAEEAGWIVTNPPYGHRISGAQDLRNLYARFGSILKSQFLGWRFCIVCSDEKLIRQMGIPFKVGPTLDNGGIKVRFYSGMIEGVFQPRIYTD